MEIQTPEVNLFDIARRKIENYRLCEPLGWNLLGLIYDVDDYTIILKIGRLAYKPLIKFTYYPTHLFISFCLSENADILYQYYVEPSIKILTQVEDTLRYSNHRDFKKMYEKGTNDVFRFLVNCLKKMEIITNELTFNTEE